MTFLTLGNHATFAFPIKRTYNGPLDYNTRIEYINDLFNKNIIDKAKPYEGMQVYITKGSQWAGQFEKVDGAEYHIIVPGGWEMVHDSDDNYDNYKVTNDNHKGEIWVLTDLDKIYNEIFSLDWETWQETPQQNSGWKKLGDGKANLQWEQLK